MTQFIDVNRLDYLNPAYVFRKNEFNRLRRINCSFCYLAADFLIGNNILRHICNGQPQNVMVLRLCFKDIWEWHIPEVMNEVSKDIKRYFFNGRYGQWDCIWMLKVSIDENPPLFFCDVVIFWKRDDSDKFSVSDIEIKLSDHENVAKVQTLIPPTPDYAVDMNLRKLCRPCKSQVLLQCKFAHNIE